METLLLFGHKIKNQQAVVLKQSLVLIFLCAVSMGWAQKKDTVLITPENLRISNFKVGKFQYLVYFKKGADAPASDMQLWNIETKEENYSGKKVLIVNQQWDYKDSVIHKATSISLAKSFKPLYHESWWNKSGKQVFDVDSNKLIINDIPVNATETNKKNKAVYNSFSSIANQYFLNWHLDLEVFSLLPYRRNVTFLIPFYEFGYEVPKNIAYTVSGEDILQYDGKKIQCWLLKHEEDGAKETFWISRKTHEVLKMEQFISNGLYRYKVKLPI